MRTTNTRTSRSPRAPRPALQLITSDGDAGAVDPSMNIVVRPGTEIHGTALVLVSGEIDADSAPRLHDCVAELVAAGRRYVVVDLDEISWVDETSLHALIDATCSAVPSDVTVLFTSDPRCLLMLKVADPDH